MLVDKVWEADQPVFTSYTKKAHSKTQSHKVRFQQAQEATPSLTPKLHQLRQDDEAGLLGDGVRKVHGSLDDGEYHPLHVLRPCKTTAGTGLG